MILRAILAAALAFLGGCGGGGEPPAGVGQYTQAIVDGTPAHEDAAVALVARRTRCAEPEPMLLCSGALVAPDLVLTAAHCLDIFGPDGQYEIFVGAALPLGRFARVRKAWIHPAYDADTHAFDAALLRLAEPLDFAPVELARVAPAVGDIATAMGYGETHGGPSHTRLQGDTRITEVAEASFTAAPGPAMSCTGDSGGPVLIGGLLAGITVKGDVACASEAVAVRVDALADFLGPALAEPPAATPPSVAADMLCSELCTENADCPGDLSCVPDAEGRGRCMVLALQEGAWGAACESDEACGSGSTCARLETDACRCFAPCAVPPPFEPPAPEAAGCSAAAGSPLLGLLALLCSPAKRRRPSEQAQGRRSLGPPTNRS